jgi:hypothetical protein
MDLQSDRYGFLVGKKITDWQVLALRVWGEVKDDTGKILRILERAQRESRRTATAQPAMRGASMPRAWVERPRNALGQFIAVAQPTGQRRSSAAGAAFVALPRSSRGGATLLPVAVPRGRTQRTAMGAGTAGGASAVGTLSDRDEKGRFTGGRGGNANDGGDSGGGGAVVHAMRDVAGSLLDVAHRLGNVPEVDPAIAAANEAKAIVGGALDTAAALTKPALAIVKPLGRGMGFMFGAGRRADVKEQKEQTGWLKKIWKRLRGKEASPAADGGGGLLAGLAGLLGLIPGGGLLVAIATAIQSAMLLAFAPVGAILLRVFGPVGAALVFIFRRTWLGLAATFGYYTIKYWDEITDTTIGTFKFIEVGFDAVFSAIGDTWDASVKMFDELWSGVKEKWDKALKTITEYFEPTKKLFEQISAWFMSLPGVQEAVDRTTKAADAINERVGVVVSGVGSRASNTAQRVIDVHVIAGKTVLDGVSGAAEGIGRFFKDARSVGYEIRTGERLPDATISLSGGIASSAKAAGVDAGSIAKMVNAESGMNPGATAQLDRFLATGGKAGSTASGMGQFTDGTWAGMVSQYGGKYGATSGLVALAQAYQADKRGALAKRGDAQYQPLFDAKLNPDAAAPMTAEGYGAAVRAMKAAGIANPTEAMVYSYWMTGNTRAALAIARNPNAAVSDVFSQAEIDGNPGYFRNAVSVGDVMGNMQRSLDRGSQYAVAARSLSMPSASAAMAAPPSIPDSPAMDTVQRLSSAATKVEVTIPRPPAGQNVEDGRIANIASGGIGN